MTEERIELSEQDELDLAALIAVPEAPAFHPILQVWREVLAPAEGERTQVVTPQWANRIVTSFHDLHYADMDNFRDSYYGKLAELANILDLEIATDDDCLTYSDPADDAKHNATHYTNLLLLWQMQILEWEMGWRCTDENAAVEIAAISEAHKMFFGPTGITAFLDNIGFEFTEADQLTLGETLSEFKEGRSE